MSKRKILFITGIRSEFYIQQPIMKAVEEHKDLECMLVVAGAHLSKKFGYTINEVKKYGFNIVGKIDNLILSDDLSARVKGAADQLSKLIDVIQKVKPDILVAPYDREESIVMALAGVYMHVPVAHLGAGDFTRVNVDGIIRHSVTKLAHFAFTSTAENKKRVIAMGEKPWRVFNIGHTGLDRYRSVPKITKKELQEYLELDFGKNSLIVVLQHPVSEEKNEAANQMKVTLQAIDQLNLPSIVINPNSDPGREGMVKVIEKFIFKKNKCVKIFPNISELYFINLLRQAKAFVGNSSMGIIDSPFLKKPVVNVGKRQRGRQNAGNVLFVDHKRNQIIQAVEKCLNDQRFRNKVLNCNNPYGNGKAGLKAAAVLAKIKPDKELLCKNIATRK